MDLKQLRESTAGDHDATESSVPLMSPDLTISAYIGVLMQLYTILCVWDAWAARHAPADLMPLVAERRRSNLLGEDLARLHAGPEATIADVALTRRLDGLLATHMPCRAAFLGAMYVVEGSTLGGQYIAKHVEDRFAFPRGEGDAYFRGYGDRTMPMWREFQAVLREVPDTDAPAVISAAKEMFTIFGEWMRHAVPTERKLQTGGR